jgi:stage II sporulation protein D
MRKQLFAAFLCGLIIPLGIMGIGDLRARWVANQKMDVESDGPSLVQPAPATEEEASPEEEITLVVLSDTGNLRQMALEEYLVGVVLSEMPAGFADDALMAQAVVARTYTCKRMDGSKHISAAICMNPACCQGYLSPEDYMEQGGSRASVDKIARAVQETRGCVLEYEGNLIDATYFSCSGGWTEDAVAVWGMDVPYLQAVESPGEEDAPRYTSRISFTPENFQILTGCQGEGELSEWFGEVTYTDGGGVDTIRICGKSYSGKELRKALGLRSTIFQVHIRNGEIVFETKGYGHRVGMSQYGAEAMAVLGSSYQQILAHYFQGTELTKWDS